MHLAHEAVATLQMPRELLDELLEACLPLCACCVLMRFRNSGAVTER